MASATEAVRPVEALPEPNVDFYEQLGTRWLPNQLRGPAPSVRN
jgi:hypothetical protein